MNLECNIRVSIAPLYIHTSWYLKTIVLQISAKFKYRYACPLSRFEMLRRLLALAVHPPLTPYPLKSSGRVRWMQSLCYVPEFATPAELSTCAHTNLDVFIPAFWFVADGIVIHLPSQLQAPAVRVLLHSNQSHTQPYSYPGRLGRPIWVNTYRSWLRIS